MLIVNCNNMKLFYKKYKILIYAVVFVILVSGICFMIYEKVVTANELESYLRQEQCPNLENFSAYPYLIRDNCSGLAWSDHDQVSQWKNGDEFYLNYTWAQAKVACEHKAPKVGDKSIFRLPYVEELTTLVKYPCEGEFCSEIVDPDSAFGPEQQSLNNYYWAMAKDPSGGVYPASVNLKTGEVNNPYYNEYFRIKARCIVDQNATADYIEGNNPSAIPTYPVETYNLNSCANQHFYVEYDGNFNLTGSSCSGNINSAMCVFDQSLDDAGDFNSDSYTGIWVGGQLSGDWICSFSSCNKDSDTLNAYALANYRAGNFYEYFEEATHFNATTKACTKNFKECGTVTSDSLSLNTVKYNIWDDAADCNCNFSFTGDDCTNIVRNPYTNCWGQCQEIECVAEAEVSSSSGLCECHSKNITYRDGSTHYEPFIPRPAYGAGQETSSQGWVCSLCGNGFLDYIWPPEGCDDGNYESGDGCSSDCQVEAGYTVVGNYGQLSVMVGGGSSAAVNGNGVVEPGEACDDSNTINGDGCSSTGSIEAGFNCGGSPSVCNPSCRLCITQKSTGGTWGATKRCVPFDGTVLDTYITDNYYGKLSVECDTNIYNNYCSVGIKAGDKYGPLDYWAEGAFNASSINYDWGGRFDNNDVLIIGMVCSNNPSIAGFRNNYKFCITGTTVSGDGTICKKLNEVLSMDDWNSSWFLPGTVGYAGFQKMKLYVERK